MYKKVVLYTFVRSGVPVREDTYAEPSACEVGCPVSFLTAFISPVSHFYYYYYFNFLQTLAHSAELVCKGPSIYKVNAKNLTKKVHIFKRSKLKSVCN